MAYRTVNLKPATYDRLVGYKRGNASLDEVVARLMDLVPEPRFHAIGAASRLARRDAPQRRREAGLERRDPSEASPDELGEI